MVNNHASKYWQWTLCLVVLLLIVTTPVSGIRVVGSRYEGTIAPGKTVVHTINLSLSQNESATDLILEVMGLGNSIGGGLQAIPALNDTSPYSARTFIQLDKYSIHLEPGKSEEVKATISVPAGITDGGRYAMINIHTPPQGGGAISLITAINVPVGITITGAKQVKAGSITNISLSTPVAGGSAVISTVMQNTGDYYFVNAVNEVKMTDINGKLMFNSSIHPESIVSIPTFPIEFSVPVTMKLDPGTYNITSKVLLSDNKTVLDEKNATVNVVKPYEPPFREVSITLLPQSSITLATLDGTKSISFPAGSVFDATKITMRPVPIDQVPTPPSNSKLGDSIFSLEGLSGLLSKEAAITIKYSPKDLEVTGSTPEQLVIARYDNLENKWIFMPTALDTAAGTLTTTTNRLSIWAVMTMEGQVPRPTETGPTTAKTPGFTIGIALGALAVLFVVNRYRRR
jgi:hypothetical protein